MSDFLTQECAKLTNVLESIRRGDRPATVDLSNCSLAEIPPEIFDLHDCLEVLNLGGNCLNCLPKEMSTMQKLRILFFAQNRFETVPSILGSLPSLYMLSFKSNKIKAVPDDSLSPSIGWLILTDNLIEELPSSIGHLARLRKLMLAGNQLRNLPDEMIKCRELELVRLASNRLERIPEWFLSLPKLSWFAYAGNMFTHVVDLSKSGGAEARQKLITFSDIELKDMVGEGASGVVYRALLRSSGSEFISEDTQEVAVKLFKGEATSDGLPEDEMKVCEAVGKHPCCIEVLGRLVDVPSAQPALVMKLVPPSYKSLGGPPSFKSVTRDTYPVDTSFSLATALRILLSVASVCMHLHERGISHGDIYAHNILIPSSYAASGVSGHASSASAAVASPATAKDMLSLSTDNPLLGDFGAASFYDKTGLSGSSFAAASIEGFEVRAFGCLAEELLDRAEGIVDHFGVQMVNLDPAAAAAAHGGGSGSCGVSVTASSAGVGAYRQLRAIQARCFGDVPSDRPRFAQLHRELLELDALLRSEF